MSASRECLRGKLGKMAIGIPERVSENLRKQLSVAVRSVQWSYGIFWSPPEKQKGKLVWGDGFYNGEIKTRKKVPAAKVCADTLGFCRSDELRELHDYESKLANSQKRESKPRPADALSREELSDLENYYLFCMGRGFNASKCLPGKALEADDPPVFWQCTAQDADSKAKQKKEKKDAEVKFTRSLEAEKASVKTVICFRHGDGVLELGVTDLVAVAEIPNLIEHIKTSLLELEKSESETKPTKEPVDVVGQTSDQYHNEASDSDENVEVDEILEQEVRLVVKFPSRNEVRIVVTFSERDRLVAKIKEKIRLLGLDKKFEANNREVPGVQKVAFQPKFQGSKSELAKSIKQAVLEAIRAIPK